MDLPAIIPLFPLPNVVLFPQVDLPLHIFEPRYREMVDHALRGDRLIGMTLLRGDWRATYHDRPEVFRRGCVGRITDFEPLPDGRSNLVLHGLCPFTIREEIGGRPYRLARVEWHPDTQDAEAHDGCEELLAGARRLVQSEGAPWPAELWQPLLREPDRLINLLAFVLPLDMVEKMALLECMGPSARAEKLSGILEFRLAERASPLGRMGSSGRRH